MKPEFAALLAQVIPVVALATGIEFREVAKNLHPTGDDPTTPIMKAFVVGGAVLLPALGPAETVVLLRAEPPSSIVIIFCCVLGFVLYTVIYVPAFTGAYKVAEEFRWGIFTGKAKYLKYGSVIVGGTVATSALVVAGLLLA